jgi:hypothetical protein
VLSTSTFVAIVYWILFLLDPKLIIENEEHYRNNSFLFLYIHGINTTILTIEIHSLEIFQFIQQNSHATQFVSIIKKHFLFFAFYCFVQYLYLAIFGMNVYPFMELLSFQ